MQSPREDFDWQFNGGCAQYTLAVASLTHFLQYNFFEKPQITKLCTYQTSYETWLNESPPITAVKGFFRAKKVWEHVKTFVPSRGQPKNSFHTASALITTELHIDVECNFSFPQEGFFYTESEVEKQYFERKSNKHRIRSSTHHLIVVNFWNGPNHCIYNNVWRPVPVRL